MLSKSVKINAPKEKVWNVMHQEQYTKTWYKEFSEETIAETDWNEGGRVKFFDGKGNGMGGKVAVFKPFEKISLEYDRIYSSGKEDSASDEAKKWIGSSETYILTPDGDTTNVTIEMKNGPEEYNDMFDKMWDKALLKIKELSEGK